jgi:hypothetical protein
VTFANHRDDVSSGKLVLAMAVTFGVYTPTHPHTHVGYSMLVIPQNMTTRISNTLAMERQQEIPRAEDCNLQVI